LLLVTPVMVFFWMMMSADPVTGDAMPRTAVEPLDAIFVTVLVVTLMFARAAAGVTSRPIGAKAPAKAP
jgi:hypothetical protein